MESRGPTVVTNRLNYDDELFLRSTLALGSPVINQTVWRFDERVDENDARELVAGLNAGPFNRRVVRSRVPGARSRWVPAEPTELVVHDRVIDPDEIHDWADDQTDRRIDMLNGPTWTISLAHTSDGGSVMSHVNEHTVSDGVFKFVATLAALRGEKLRVLPAREPEPTGLRADLADAWTMTKEAVRGVREAVRLARQPTPQVEGQRSNERPVPEPRPGDDAPFFPPEILVDCPLEQWKDAAARHGGTMNTLLVAITTEMLLAAGLAEAGRPVRVSMPVNDRGEDDLRSNATSAVTIVVPTEPDGRVTDLAAIRSATKAELTAHSAGERPDAIGPLKPLLQMLPDPAVRAYAKNVTSALCMTSNLGVVDPLYLAPFGTPASSIVLRSVGRGMTKNKLRRQRGGMTVWCAVTDRIVNLTVAGMDPDAFPDRASLRRVTTAVYERWGLTPTFW